MPSTSTRGYADGWIESFPAWVWEPPYIRLRVRGLSNADVHIRPGGFTIEPRRFYQRLGGWAPIEYDWSAVVLEDMLPLGGPGLLFEMPGGLARCQVRAGDRLRAALGQAGLIVIEVTHWGWERPRPAPASVIRGYERSVPAAVVAADR